MNTRQSDDWLAVQLASLGRVIRAKRTALGLTRTQLGTLAEVGTRQIGKIERGERGQVDELWRLAQAMGTTLSQLSDEAERSIGRRELLAQELSAMSDISGLAEAADEQQPWAGEQVDRNEL